MTFQTIVRNWCRRYKPMLDNIQAGNQRFFLTDSYLGMVEFAKSISNAQSPCVVMESNVEGYLDGGRIVRNYYIYFFVRARNMADGDAAAEAKEEAWAHAQHFITWLRNRCEQHPTCKDLRGIDLDSSIDIQTVGPIENGWFGVLLQISRYESLNLCEEEQLYIELPSDCDCGDSE